MCPADSTIRIARRGLLLCAAAVLAGCANDVTDTLIERPLGALSELAINLQFRMDDDPLLHGYVNELGREHRTHVRRKNVPYRFKIADVEAPNAFAIPWGGVYVTRGLLRFADSEDEISFVIGHEIGHVERRHSSMAFQRNLLIQIGLALLTNNNNKDWMQFAYIGNYFLDLHWSRQNETAADGEGVMYAFLSGYDPEYGTSFFRRLDREYGRTPRFWGYFQTHPVNVDRVNYINSQPALAGDDPVVLTTIGDGYSKRFLFASAERRYQQALSADQVYGPAHLGLARIAAWRGDVQVARARYLDAMRYGVEPAVVNAELGRLPGEAVPEKPDVILASNGDVADVTAQLEQEGTQVAGLQETVAPLWQEPFDAASALVSGYDLTGNQLDSLYRIRDQLSKPVGDEVVGAQKARALAMTAAAQVSAVQSEAKAALDLTERNRQRILARLEDRPTAREVAVARQVLLDSEHARADVADASQRLREVMPEVRQAVQRTQRAIEGLHHSVNNGGRQQLAGGVSSHLSSAEEDTNGALRQARKAGEGAFTARSRALQSSIDITMLDRPRHQRLAAQRIIERLTLTPEEQSIEALQSGLSYGEAAYVLGLARSGAEEVQPLLGSARDATDRHTIDRLDRGARIRTANVAIMLKLIDLALKREFEPDALTEEEQL